MRIQVIGALVAMGGAAVLGYYLGGTRTSDARPADLVSNANFQHSVDELWHGLRTVEGKLGAQTPDGREALGSSVTELRQRLGTMSGEVHALRNDVEASANGSPDREGLSPAREDETEIEDPELEAERRAQEIERHVEQLEVRLSDEARSDEWAVDTEQAIAEALEEPRLESTRLMDVACRATMCRAELEHLTDQGREDFLDEVPSLPPFNRASGFIPPIAEGADRNFSVVYLTWKS